MSQEQGQKQEQEKIELPASMTTDEVIRVLYKFSMQQQIYNKMLIAEVNHLRDYIIEIDMRTDRNTSMVSDTFLFTDDRSPASAIDSGAQRVEESIYAP